MDDNRKKKLKAFLLMSGSILLPSCWGLLLSFLNTFWYKTYSFLPDCIYFPVEEFFAFNIHNNTMFMKLPMAFLFVVFFIWALVENGRNIKFFDFLMIIFVLIFFIFLMMPCLCRPMEYVRRKNCAAVMHSMYQTMSSYAENFPDRIELEPHDGHKIHYFGEGKNINDSKFILFEDADRVHAGNLKHRMYSDGTVEHFYPWKKEKK
ncbi:MAG: hypothetical protein IKB71_00415 [Lentisphaeria bacterium]|nr:hypothetical protein [Lentisphaeria bacterium]